MSDDKRPSAQPKWMGELNHVFSWKDIDLVKETQDIRKDMAKYIMDLKTSIATDDRNRDHEFPRTKNTLSRILTKMSSFQITSIPECSPSYVMRYNFEQVVDQDTDKTQVCEIDKTTFYGVIIEYISIIEEVIYSYPKEIETTRTTIRGDNDNDDNNASLVSLEFRDALSEQIESLDALKEIMIKNQEISSQNIREEYSAYKDKIEPYVNVGEYTKQNSSMESTQPEWKDLMKTAKIRSKVTEEYPRGVTPSAEYKNSQEDINTEAQTPTEPKNLDIDGSDLQARKKEKKQKYNEDLLSQVGLDLESISRLEGDEKALAEAERKELIYNNEYKEYLLSQVGLDLESISRLEGREKAGALNERKDLIDDIKDIKEFKKSLQKRSGKVYPTTFSSELEKMIPSIISSRKKDEENQSTQHMLDQYYDLKRAYNKTLKERKKNKGGKNSKKKSKKSKKPRKWSTKYKRSIDCSKPKGFSQKQYCKYGRKSKKVNQNL